MMLLLQMGGKCGVIVPDGVLFGRPNAHKKLRQMLLETCQLEGIVSMPSGVFKPYAGVSTAVLIFTKGGATDKVWFYDMEAEGYSLDDKRTFIDGKGDIPDIIRHYHNRKKESPRTGKPSASLCLSARSRKTGMTCPSRGIRKLSIKKSGMKSRK